MTRFPLESEADPVRREITAAMNRLFVGTPQRSNGRLNVTQLAIEAGLKRWHLTHQHPDLKDLFQEHAAKDDAQRAAHVRSTDAFEDLKKKYTELQAHCRFLEARLQTVATAAGLLALENAALSGQDPDDAKVRVLPRRQYLP